MFIVQKCHARSNWKRTKYPANKYHYNTLIQKLKRLISNYRNESYTNHITYLTKKDSLFWKVTRQILHIRHSPTISRNPDVKWAYSDEEKANIFANHLADTFMPHDDILLSVKINAFKSFFDFSLQISFSPKDFSLRKRNILYLIFPKKSY